MCVCARPPIKSAALIPPPNEPRVTIKKERKRAREKLPRVLVPATPTVFRKDNPRY